MIPGTLRPLPKKIKEVKTDAEKVLRTSQMDLENAKEMLKESSLYTFEEINIQYMRIIENHSNISPLEREADKLLNKYINDHLLNELVYKLHRDLESTQFRLRGDSQRMETILMSKRKAYIEEMIPRLKDETKSKLSFLKDLSLDEILEKSQVYGNTISEIVGKLNAVQDEYLKLSDGSFDVSEFYAPLKDKMSEVEEELEEYQLILRTCKMQILSEEAENLIEEGNVITNEFEMEKTSEQVLKADDYVKTSSEKLSEMSSLRVSIPRRGISKEFSIKFQELSKQFEASKNSLTVIRDDLESKTNLFSTQINWINTIRAIAESDGEEIKDIFKKLKVKGSYFNLKLFDVKEREIRINPKIRLKGTFTLALLEGNFPVFELSPLGLVKLPLGEEMTTEKLEEVLSELDKLAETAFMDEFRNRRKANRLLKEKEQRETIFMKIEKRLSPAFSKVKETTKTGIRKISETSKKGYSKSKSFFQGLVKKGKATKAKKGKATKAKESKTTKAKKSEEKKKETKDEESAES
ncbi:MAG: hypothetical protein V3V41_10605 [Candidatus Heimdallarchaeota archaeon]